MQLNKILLRKLLIAIAGLLLLGVMFIVCVNVYILKTTGSYIFNEPNDVPDAQAVMILGAFVFNDGRMSDVLNDRVLSALEIYDRGKVSRILVSGDHGREEYDEVNTVYISKALGIETYGYVADRQPYLNSKRYEMRESLARMKAFFNVILHSKPRYLGDIIPIAGDGRKSWD